MLLLFALGVLLVLLLWWWWYPVLKSEGRTPKRGFGGLLREISFFRYLILFFLVACYDTLNKFPKTKTLNKGLAKKRG